MKLRRDIRVYDKGQGAFEIRYAVVGKYGAVEFHGNLYPENHPVVETSNRYGGCHIRTQRGSHFDACGIEYHGFKPLGDYMKGEPSQSHCQLLNAPCYHDGTSLQAFEFARGMGQLHKDIIFGELEGRYNEKWYA